jgi:hypothetical protein
MNTLGHGQKTGQILQTAALVPDMRAAFDWWIKDGKMGPWFPHALLPYPHFCD